MVKWQDTQPQHGDPDLTSLMYANSLFQRISRRGATRSISAGTIPRMESVCQRVEVKPTAGPTYLQRRLRSSHKLANEITNQADILAFHNAMRFPAGSLNRAICPKPGISS